MLKTAHPNFDKMDELSQQKVPFFFMVDFLAEKVELYIESELKENSLLIDFQYFKNTNSYQEQKKNIHLNSFPESKEDYRKGFDQVQQNLKLGNSYLTN